MSPNREGEGIYCFWCRSCWHSGIGVSFNFIVSMHYILNQLLDFDQTCTDTLLGGGEELFRFW